MQPELAPLDPQEAPPRWPRLTAALVGLSALVILCAILVRPTNLWSTPPRSGAEQAASLPPGLRPGQASTALGKADLVGYAICHRIPERSFFLGGRQLPLCARCTGTFLGALLGLAWMGALRRGRASRLPPVPVLAMLVICMGLWAFDGLNSYMTFFPGAPHLYEPRNWLRMTTGVLNGVALIIFVFPIFNFTLWRRTEPEPVIRNAWELVALLPAVVVLVVVTQAEIGFLLYPLALASSLGALMMLAIINTMLVTVVLGREGYALTWRQTLVPLLVGTALATLEVVGLVLMRSYLTAKLGVPF